MANSSLQNPQPAWALLITRTAGSPSETYLAASSDLTQPADVTALGTATGVSSPVFLRRITNALQIRVTDQLGDWTGGIISPSTATIQCDNSDSYFDTAAEWRNVAATLYHYERSEATVRTALDGIIVEADFVLGRATFTIATHDPSIWSTLLPAAVINPTDFPSASDQGAPIPVVFGIAYLSPPSCGYDDDPSNPTDNPGGYDYLIGVQQDEAADSINLEVQALYYDQDTAAPGMELANGWMNCPGTITQLGPTTFSATGDDYSQWYSAVSVVIDGKTVTSGAAYRTITVFSGFEGEWRYGWIAGYDKDTGVVTVADITIDAAAALGGFITAINPVPTAAGSSYVVGDELTVVSPGALYGRVVVAAVNGSGGVTKLKLKHPGGAYPVAAGLATTGGTGTSCTVEVTAVATAQIAPDYWTENNRYEYDGQDLVSVRLFVRPTSGVVVRARSQLTNPADVIREILVNTTWGLGQTVDETSFTTAASAYTAVGLGTAINAALGGDRQQRQAGQIMRELLALYGGRLTKTSAGWALTVDSAPSAAAVTFGVDDGTFNNVKRVETNGKRPLSEAIKTLHLRFGPAGRIKTALDYGTAYLPGNYSFVITAACLAVGSEQTIISPWLRYSSHAQRVLAYASKAIKYGDQQPVIVVGQEARVVGIGDLVNYINVTDGVNATFRVWRIERRLADIRLSLAGYNAAQFTYSAGDTSTVNDVLDLDEARMASGHGGNLLVNSDFSAGVRYASKHANMVPGWEMFTPSSFSSFTVTPELACIGGNYLSVPVTTASSGSPAEIGSMDLDNKSVSMGVMPQTPYIASVYADQSVGWRFRVVWFKTDSTTAASSPIMQVDPEDTNGLGWPRYYCVVRSSELAGYGELLFDFTATGTYKFDAVQFEEAGKFPRPTDWKRNTRWGIDPALLQPGSLTIRLPGETEHGTVLGHATDTIYTGAEATGISVGLIPAGVVVQGVTTYQTGLTGFTSFNIGTALDPTAWGEEIAVSEGARTDASDFTLINPPTFPTATDVVITPIGGAFAGGSIKVTVHYIQFVAPTG